MKDDGEPKVGRPRTVRLDPESEERGARCARIREAAGFQSQKEFADWLKIEPSRWNNVERGKPISNAIANLLVQRIHGLSHGYVQAGDTRGMPDDLLVKLGERPGPTPTLAGRTQKARLSRR